MADVSNIRIITDLGDLDYKQAEDLGISFNRVVDDMTDISNRFQDFSYDFELPFTRGNSLVFGAPESKGSRKYFVVNRSLPCQVYMNNELLLDGLINLESITRTGYKCKFYSKLKELIDSLDKPADGKEKTLRDLKFPVIENWDYENSLIDHIRANYHDCTETFYQFPLCHYSTFYTQYGIYSGQSETLSRGVFEYFNADDTYQNFYYLINSNFSGSPALNRFYIHQIPPAVYIVPVLQQIMKDAGWKLGGQFFDNKDVKRIVLTYAGDEDAYDQATGIFSGSSSLSLQIAKFLPDMKQSDFLKSLVNLFNLYIKVDVQNKIVTFETYNTIFGDSFDPYDITSKVDRNTLEFYYEENNDPSIIFEKANNRKITGDDKVMSGATDSATSQEWVKVSNTNYNGFFNKIGSTDKIDIDFSEPNVQRVFIWNDVDALGFFKFKGPMTMFLPCLTKQTPTDNDSKKFNAATGDTYVKNNENTIKFAGKGSLMYYYGQSTTTFENVPSGGTLADYLYINIYTGVSFLNRVRIGICSPFQLFNHRDYVEVVLSGVTDATADDPNVVACTYLQSIWQMMGRNTTLPSSATTEFSLVFDDTGLHETLWTKFHKTKYDRYKNSEMLKAQMRMNAFDWKEMQIERPVMYDNEIYNLVEISGYNPVKRKADVKLIKR